MEKCVLEVLVLNLFFEREKYARSEGNLTWFSGML